MAEHNAELELLFGVLGKGKVSGQSGTLIRQQLNQLVGELNNAKNTNERKIRFSVDTGETKKIFRSKLQTIVNDVSSTNSFKIKVSKVDASNAITDLRNQINDALKMLKIDTGFDVSVNADGSKSAVKQIAQDAESAIKRVEELKASIAEAEQTATSLGSSYNKAKNALGGENATGDDANRLEEMRKKYIDMNALLGEIKEKQKNGFVVNPDEITRLRQATAEVERLINSVLNPEPKTPSTQDVLLDRFERIQRAQDTATEAFNKANDVLLDKRGVESNANALANLKIKYEELLALIQKLEGIVASGAALPVKEVKDLENTFTAVMESAEDLGGKLTERSDLKGYNKALSDTEGLLAKVKAGEEGWTKAKKGSSSDEYNKLSTYRSDLEALKKDLEDGKLSMEDFSKRFDSIAGKFKVTSSTIKAAGENTKTFAERFGDLAEKFSKWLTVSQVVMFAVRQLRKMVTTVIELDDAMTELKKVTDETDSAYEKFFDNASKRAKELGSTIKDTINATASFARLGYDIADASTLADAAVIYNNVGDEIESIDDASQSIISTMQAFGVEAQDVMSIVDKFNAVGKLLPKSIVICWAKALLVAISVKGQRWFRPSKDFAVLVG